MLKLKGKNNKTLMKKLDRLLYTWTPLLLVYLYAFSVSLKTSIISQSFLALPFWVWIILYISILISLKILGNKYAITLVSEEVTKKDKSLIDIIESDIFIFFIFSVLSFALIILITANKLSLIFKPIN